jgi:uncharacterized protein (TIGR02246 family)
MTRHLALALAALVLTLPSSAIAQGGGDTRGQIEKMAKAWEKAYNSGDAAAVAALYAKDAKLMPPGAEPATGPSAIQAFLVKDIKGGAKMALTTEDVTGSGDYALETGKWVATSADGKHLDHGQYATFYKKADGGWKIVRDTWNSSMAPK